MREILFRAKAANRDVWKEYRSNYKNGDWVYGLITVPASVKYNCPAEMRNTVGISGIEVDYKTIGEWTGQTDYKNVDIFEYDIVRCALRSDDTITTVNMVVIFEDGEFRMVKCKDYRVDPSEREHYSISYFYKRVIGNIWDNPELMPAVEKSENTEE